MLALTQEELAPTDTTDPAIEAIVDSGIREILVLGRRGPAQAAFTTPELQELGELAGADIVVDPADLDLDSASEAALAEDTPIARRNVEVLREYAVRTLSGKPRCVKLRFCVSPGCDPRRRESRGDGDRAERTRRGRPAGAFAPSRPISVR